MQRRAELRAWVELDLSALSREELLSYLPWMLESVDSLRDVLRGILGEIDGQRALLARVATNLATRMKGCATIMRDQRNIADSSGDDVSVWRAQRSFEQSLGAFLALENAGLQVMKSWERLTDFRARILALLGPTPAITDVPAISTGVGRQES